MELRDMTYHHYKQRDFTFGQLLVTLRRKAGLTQEEVALKVGAAGKSIRNWEGGSNYPTEPHLQKLIELYLDKDVFEPGREREEAVALWEELQKSTHRHTSIFDEQWFAALLEQSRVRRNSHETSPDRLGLSNSSFSPDPYTQAPLPTAHLRREDWGDALDVPSFAGREQELAQLEQWVLNERCRLVALLGMGGIGKTVLATTFAHQVADQFEVVIWRSLYNAPSCEALLDDCLQTLSPQELRAMPATLEQRISLLLEHLRKVRVLLILDNLESLLVEEDVRGHLRPGLEGYEQLLHRIAETAHQSCLLLTSREKPAKLRPLAGKHSPVRSLRLEGLDAAACQQLLEERELVGSEQEQAQLIEIYAGNPLALKIVAETISDLFNGDIGQFLAGGMMIFGNITDLLDEQFARLSVLEQSVLCWLAIVREPVTLDELLALLVTPRPAVQVFEAVDACYRRSLIERGKRAGSFTLQSVVLEYVTAVLIAEGSREIQEGQLDRLIEHGLSLAQAKEYVRQTQERLLLCPLLANLQRVYPLRGELEQQLLSLFDQLRERIDTTQGYGPANLIALLRISRGNLSSLDLSKLFIRSAYLQGIEMQNTSLCGAMIRDTAFTEALDAIWAVAVSPNGRWWAASCRRGEVLIWDGESQTLHHAWQAHTDIVPTLTFSPDGQTLATGSWDGTVKLWKLDTLTLLWKGKQANTATVAFSPDGSILASCGRDTTIKLWDTQSGTNLQTLPHPGYVYAVVWSPDGRFLASGDFAGSIRLWQIEMLQPPTCVQTLEGHTNWVMGLAFAPDGRTLVSGSWDNTVKLWDMANGRMKETLEGHTDQVHRVAWSPDGRTLASCSIDRTIQIFDVERGRCQAVLHGHTSAVYDLAFTPGSNRLLSGSEDGTLRVWEVTSGECLRIIQGYAVSIYDVDWSPDGTQLVSGGTDGLVLIWDAHDRNPPKVLRGHRWIVAGVGWSPEGRFVASSGWDAVMYLWDQTSYTSVQRFDNPPPTPLTRMAWSPDGHLLACGTLMHGVQVWDVGTGNLRWPVRMHPAGTTHVAWSPDGTRFTAACDDGIVYEWDATDGQLQRQLQGHHGVVTRVAWSPDGKLLASGGGSSGNGELFVWDTQSGERVRAFVGHPDIVFAVAWGRTGKRLISGSSDGVIRWWDVETAECVSMRTAHRGTIQSLRVSPDGKQLASCGDDGAIMIWDMGSFELLRTLRRDRPYERLNIMDIRGLNATQKDILQSLGAVDSTEDARVTI